MSTNDDPNEQGDRPYTPADPQSPGGQTPGPPSPDQPGQYGQSPPPPSDPYGAPGRPEAGADPYGQPNQPGQYGQPDQPNQPGQYGAPSQGGQYGQAPPPGQSGGYAQAPQYGQPMNPGAVSPSDARMWAMFSHLAAILLWFLAPLIIYLVFKDRDPFIRHHAARSLNFQIIVTVAVTVSWILTFVLIGFILLPLIFIAALVFIIMAGIAANKGQDFKYPITPDWVR